MHSAPQKVVNRSAAPVVQRAQRPAAATVPTARISVRPGSVQAASTLRVSSPTDAAEREAEQTARQVMSAPDPQPLTMVTPRRPLMAARSPYVARLGGHIVQRDASLARRSAGMPQVAPGVAAEISASQSGGAPLPPAVRRFMEPRFGAQFDKVRVHTGDRAARLSTQLSARAFTVGNHVYFGRDQFQPDNQAGRELIAHELTHTIQQGAIVQRSAVWPETAHHAATADHVTVTERSASQVQRLGISDALDYFADKVNVIPGFRLFTIIIGRNPINMRPVERSAANVLRAMVEFLPGGGLIVQALDRYGIFDQVGGWVEGQLRTLGLAADSIRQAIDEFLDSLSWTDIASLGSVWNRAKRIFTDPIDRILEFASGLVSGIIRFIKDAILRPLAQLAQGTRGYDLLKAVLGRDPITGDPVPRSADTLIGGFMKLIGQEEIWNNLKRANAVPRAWAWFQGALAGLLGFVRQLPSQFLAALQQLELADIVLVPRAFAKIAAVFGGFVGQFLSWAGQQVLSLLQIIFEVVAPGAVPYVRRAAGAFRTIIQDPIGFVGNLVRAGILGFRQFARHFLTHLRASLIGWLTGTLGGANIYIPQAFTLREIIKFVLSVLGLTWQNIRVKLVRVVGETAVAALETGFDVVMTLVTQGPAAAWEKIQESLTNLREMVMDQIMTFVRDRVVQAAITKLITSLNPAGAFIQAIIATYNTIMFFVERLRQIAQVAMSFIDSIAAIASGVISTAANRVERTMAGLLTLVISFLARIAGLGKVSDAVVGIINRVREPIDKALDRVVQWIVAQATRLGRLTARAAQGVAARVSSWLGLRRPFRTAGGVSHTVLFRPQGAGVQLAIRSDEMSLEAFLRDLARRYARDPGKLALVTTATALVAEIRGLTAPSAAPANPPNADINGAVLRLIDQLLPILQQIGDGVSMDGATAAYRGLHWWVDARHTNDQAAVDPLYLANLARQELGARQLSDAVQSVLQRGITSDVDEAIRIVRSKMESLRDGTPYVEEGKTYFDRFHFLVGRYVTKLQALRTRFAAQARILELDVEIAQLQAALATLAVNTRDYFETRRRLREAQAERSRNNATVTPVYRELSPQVLASPFVATSLSARKAAEYAVGSLFTPVGKKRRTAGVVGRMLAFVASIPDLVRDGTYKIDELAAAQRIKIRQGFSERELTFTGSIPGEYLRATLEVTANQTEDAVASSASGRAAAEAARFGGLR